VFLITVGMSVDLHVVVANWQTLLLAVVGVIVAKAIVTAGLLRLSGSTPGLAAETGLLMASPSETTLIVLAAAAQARLIMPSTAAFWQIVTAIGLTITPLLARVGHDIARKVEARRATAMGQREEPAEGSGRTIIIGFGRVGRIVAQMLDAHGHPYLAIDANIDTITAARRDGFHIAFGDITHAGMMERLRLGQATALVLTMDEPVEVIRTVRRVRALHPDLIIIARARDTVQAAELYRAGATEAVPETVESSLQLSEAVLIGLGVAMGPVIASIHEKRAELRARIVELGDLPHEHPFRARRRQEID
jgi:CPA2 family monovalent cation:H+ antiporter-2